MRKIPAVFRRDPTDMSRLLQEPHPDATWVLAGEGTPTRKYDGTCVMLDDQGAWWARREIKPGKPLPTGFVEAEHDPATGKTQGWEPIDQSGWARWFGDALSHTPAWPADEHPGEPYYKPGTYELCGPKVNGNPEGYDHHVLIAHTDAEVTGEVQPRTFDTIRALIANLAEQGIEGVVYHHPDGRMAKIKGRDFR